MPKPIRKPVFIVGCGRSGTTLLFDLLSQHSLFARTTGYPDGEDHEGWIEHGRCVMAGIGNVYDDKYETGINGYNACLHMTGQDVDDDIIAAMHRHYETSVLRGAVDKRVLNKQPHLSNKLQYLLAIFPDAKIIHIVRDCKPMVSSFLAVMDDHPSLVVYWPAEEFPCLWLLRKPTDRTALAVLARHERFYPGGGAPLFVDYWCQVNAGIERQMVGRLDQLCVVRYEDLIARPSAVLGKLQDFCELGREDLDVASIEPGRQGKFKDLVSPDLAAFITRRARALRRYYGYTYGFPWNVLSVRVDV